MNASPAELELRHAVRMMCQHEPVVQRAIVACSGGPDSIALAAAAAWEATHGGPPAHAVIVNHQAQPDSAAVSQRAAEACRALGLDADVVAVDVGTEGGFEAAAREARYRALAEAAKQHRADAVLLGHTRNDQAETVLLRLLRGSGARSLAAMRPIHGLWRRPFLDISREQVHGVAAEIAQRVGIPIWDDPHNSDPAFARVQVRQLLAQWPSGPAAVLGLSRSAALLADDADLMDALAEEAEGTCLDSGELVIDDLVALPRAVRTRVLRRWLTAQGSPPGDLDYAHVSAVDSLVTDWHGQGPVTVPGGFGVERAYGRLRMVPTPKEP